MAALDFRPRLIQRQEATVDESMRTTKPIPEQLKNLREARGLSQSELARRTGLHQSYVSAVESGKRRSITLPMLEKWTKALGGRLIVLD